MFDAWALHQDAPVPQAPGQPAGGMAVFAVEGGRARVTPVRLGARDGSEAWIREGLAAGSTVIVYPPPAVHDGVKVKPRKV